MPLIPQPLSLPLPPNLRHTALHPSHSAGPLHSSNSEQTALQMYLHSNRTPALHHLAGPPSITLHIGFPTPSHSFHPPLEYTRPLHAVSEIHLIAQHTRLRL